jgi:large subunit ribosomal protein L3
MISGFLVKKGQMTSVYTSEGKRIPITKCVAQPLKVTQIKNKDKDGYESIQVVYGNKKRKEFKLTSNQVPEINSDITIESVFTAGDKLDVTGISKGHGFAGVVKRHGFKKQPLLGASNYVRHPGSIGAQTPGKVVKGKKMPGHFGVETVTISGLEVFSINPETKEILIKGSLPGSINSWVILKKIV